MSVSSGLVCSTESKPALGADLPECHRTGQRQRSIVLATRKSISKKSRFEVFKRDFFTCQYCGSTPPKVILHIDHIKPVAAGGGNEIDNLLTSCESCNQGKGATPLSSVPKSLSDRAKEVKEREEQINGYNSVMTERSQRIERDAWSVVAALQGVDRAESCNKDEFLSIKRFIERMPLHLTIEAAEMANARVRSQYSRFKYFCGICWTMIRRNEDAEG